MNDAKQEVMSVFRLLRLVRDARSTQNADRALLIALAMRCQPAKKFISWPSYRLLAQDTQLDEITLKRAAKRLEDSKLIRRVKRANRSNTFFINAALLQQQAAVVKAAEEAAKKHDEVESPFEEPLAVDHEVSGEDDAEVGGWNVGGAR
jgi:DNA-binding transcriptional regulator YhcF (GntR family)